VTFQYDGDGNRVAMTAGGVTTTFLVDTVNPTGHSQVLEELVGGAVQRVYTYGSSRISQSQILNGAWLPPSTATTAKLAYAIRPTQVARFLFATLSCD
jgi:hypothetical protein